MSVAPRLEPMVESSEPSRNSLRRGLLTAVNIGIFGLMSGLFYQAIADYAPWDVDNWSLPGFGRAMFMLIVPSSFLVLFIEAVVLVLRGHPFRQTSLGGFFRFTVGRQTDLLFWVYFQSGLVSTVIVVFPGTFIRPWAIERELVISGPVQWALVVVAVFLLNSFFDFCLHRWSHSVPEMWELHKYHHAAAEMNVLNSQRDHPLLNARNNLIRGVVLGILGLPLHVIGPVLLVKTFQASLQHSKLNDSWGFFGKIFMSPRAHWIHHSTDPRHYNRNFGSDITLWDRMFGTYVGDADVTRMTVGLTGRDRELDSRNAFHGLWACLVGVARRFRARF